MENIQKNQQLEYSKSTIAMSFHKFSLEWENYIEKDRVELVINKDKLKVEVTLQLVTFAASSKTLPEVAR